MAQPEKVYWSFEHIQQTIVDSLKLNGYVIREQDFWRNRLLLFYHFDFKYLRVRDQVWYDNNELPGVDIIYDLIATLKSIEYQFRFYFDGIWG